VSEPIRRVPTREFHVATGAPGAKSQTEARLSAAVYDAMRSAIISLGPLGAWRTSGEWRISDAPAGASYEAPSVAARILPGAGVAAALGASAGVLTGVVSERDSTAAIKVHADVAFSVARQ
jgi:hypothetical protein